VGEVEVLRAEQVLRRGLAEEFLRRAPGVDLQAFDAGAFVVPATVAGCWRSWAGRRPCGTVRMLVAVPGGPG
jgi:hypothetical protein